MKKPGARRVFSWMTVTKAHHLGNHFRHAFGVLRDPAAAVLAHHGRVAVAELAGDPLNRDVARQCLARERVECLVGASMANACFLKVGGEPVADGLAVPQQAACGAAE